MVNKLPNNWWKTKLIDAFISYWWRATNKELKDYFLEYYSNEIFKTVKPSSLAGSINWQLQFFSKKDWGNNYKNRPNLFHKIERWLWTINEWYENKL